MTIHWWPLTADHWYCLQPGDKSEDISCKTEEEPQPQQRRPSYVRRPSRNKMAHIENQKRRLRRHAINWVAIAAAAVASSADNLDLREFDEDSMSGGSRDESHVYYDEETFSRSLQPPSDVNSVRSGSPNTASTNRTDLLFWIENRFMRKELTVAKRIFIRKLLWPTRACFSSVDLICFLQFTHGALTIFPFERYTSKRSLKFIFHVHVSVCLSICLSVYLSVCKQC